VVPLVVKDDELESFPALKERAEAGDERGKYSII
jgi:hypothetical protein